MWVESTNSDGKNKAYIHQQKLADAILYFLNNPKTAEQYAESAREHASKNSTVNRMAKETLAAYKKLMAQKAKTIIPSRISYDAPLVSIFLLAYNAAKHIKQCIISILGHKYTKFELLIINDGSTNATVKIIKGFNDDRISLMSNDSNMGIVNSANKLLALAKGKYITRVDADDILHEDSLLKRLDFLEKNSDYAMVGNNHFVIDPEGRPISLMQYPDNTTQLKTLMYFRNSFC